MPGGSRGCTLEDTRCPFRKSFASAFPWDRRAPGRLQKPRWSVALPGKTLGNWWCIYETDIYGYLPCGPGRLYEDRASGRHDGVVAAATGRAQRDRAP